MAQTVTSIVRPHWQIIYQGTDISGNIARWVTEVTWCERLGEQVSEASFTVEDAGRRWQGSSYPKITDSVQLAIGYYGAPLTFCGNFTVDMFELSGPADRMRVSAIEGGPTVPLRSERNVRYENLTLSEIAAAVAARHGWTADTSAVSPDVPWENLMQFMDADGTDMEFLRRIANDHGYEVQLKPPKLIFYSRTALEAQTPVGSITRRDCKSFRFTWQSLQERTLAGVVIAYLNPDDKSTYSATAVTNGTPPTADTRSAVQRVENAQQAALKAQAQLHAFNMLGYQAELVLPGTTKFRAGNVVTLADWGNFQGSWLVEEAEHVLRASAGGYTTKLTMRTLGPGESLLPAATYLSEGTTP